MGNYLKVKSLGEQALIQYDWCGYKKGKLGDYPGGKIPIQEFFPGGSDGKESTCNTGDLGSTPGLGRSPGEGNDNPLQQSYLENPMDRGAQWATVHGITRVGHDLMTKPPPMSNLLPGNPAWNHWCQEPPWWSSG